MAHISRFYSGVYLFLYFAVFLWATESLAINIDGTLHPSELRVEYHENPLGIDIKKPRHSWIVKSGIRGDYQKAYQIVVATNLASLNSSDPDLWDSGKIESSATNQITYSGQSLGSGMQVIWKVRVWDKEGRVSNWSKPAHWSMGLLRFSDWTADWIGFDVDYATGEMHLPPSPYLRTEFKTKGKIRRATLYASALGLYEMRLNGERVGDAYFTPGWTDYNKRVYYSPYDVTDQISEGANALGAILADGWYSGYVGYGLLKQDEMERVRGYWGERPALLAQLEIEYTNGEKQTIATVSDRHRAIHPENTDVWKASTGPIREADILMGEIYDARLEINGWDKPGFDDTDWQPVRWRPPAVGKLEAHPGVPVRKQEIIKPVSIAEREPGVFIFDMGKNFAGIVRLKVNGDAGDKVTLRFGEMLHLDGSLMTENLRKARVTDSYILKGDGEEVWEPQFTYHGFQFVEVTGFPGRPMLDAITGIRLNSETPQVGNIKIEKDINWGGQRGLITQLFENIKTTQFANFFDIPTDCPQRDERMGWTGDAQVYVRTSTYVADVAAFFTKWLPDLRDAQRAYGAYTNYAPFPYSHVYDFSPGWMDAGVIVPYTLFQAYGDRRMLEQHWNSMTRFMQFQIDAAGDDLLRPGSGRNYGDWLAVGYQTDKSYLASAYFGYDAKLMAEMALAIGKTEEAEYYTELFQKIRRAFADRYIDSEGHISENSQTAYAMALAMDLFPAELRGLGAEYLATMVRNNGNKLSTGFLGVRHLLPILSEFGYDDLAYALLTQTKYPSWGYEVVNGATSIWERWNGFNTKDGFSTLHMNSFSHYSFGSVGEWMFSSMAGIEATSPGYETIKIRPLVSAAPFDGVEASYKSIRGMISSHWRKVGGKITLNVSVPANVDAEIYVPTISTDFVTEGGIPTEKANGVVLDRLEQGYAVFKVGGGNYEFMVHSPYAYDAQ